MTFSLLYGPTAISVHDTDCFKIGKVERQSYICLFNLYAEHRHAQSLSPVRLFVIPWTAVHQASLSITNSQSLLKLTSTESVMPSNYLILCRPLLLLPLIIQYSSRHLYVPASTSNSTCCALSMSKESKRAAAQCASKDNVFRKEKCSPKTKVRERNSG